RSLTHELMARGAQKLNPGRPNGVCGREMIMGMVLAYEGFRQKGGMPANYQVINSLLEKAL
ncbi:malonyl-[acyl-carrier protein] O-methyltransferase BioC, partial [Pseudomonas syringae pv. tagetis]